MDTRWSLEELAEKSQDYLTDEGDSRRVQWKPNGRQIRYYSTLGLLDKPDTENGRVVWYSTRHLIQLLAIKRLQLDGLKLAEVQRSLAGAKLDELRRIAGLPEEILEGVRDSVSTPASPRQEAFWMTRPTTPPPPTFEAVWQLKIAPGVTLNLDSNQFDSMTPQESEALAAALLATWKKHQQQRTKENP